MSIGTIAVAGAGGFIGGHLVASLLRHPHEHIRAIDSKPLDQWHQRHPGVENIQLDLSDKSSCYSALLHADHVYNLAADMGGMGFIAYNKALCTLSVTINAHLLLAALHQGVSRYFFASSACVYPDYKQSAPDARPLKEEDAFPASPEPGYGEEKLFSERMCIYFHQDFGLNTRMARYHNVYGPYGTYAGGREKAPAALCRKVAEAKISGCRHIEVWGDGNQTRSFMYIDDCTYGTDLIMQSDICEPLNLGSTEVVTINELLDTIEDIAGIQLIRKYDASGPQGVRGRSSDNSALQRHFGWQPSITLYHGLEDTYRWIYDQVSATGIHAGSLHGVSN